MTVRVRSGGVTATITGIESATIRAMIGRAMGGALKVMEDRAEELAADARREWYGPNGVNRETGKSGDIQVVTTADLDRGEVRVSIGSTDDRKVIAQRQRKRTGDSVPVGKPVPVYVHQPWKTSLHPKAVDRVEWFRWRKLGLPTLPPPPDAFGTQKTGEAAARSAKAAASSKAFWSDAAKTKGLDVGKWYVLVAGQDSGDAATKSSSYLLQRLVKKPGKALAREVAPEVARAIAQAVNRG